MQHPSKTLLSIFTCFSMPQNDLIKLWSHVTTIHDGPFMCFNRWNVIYWFFLGGVRLGILKTWRLRPKITCCRETFNFHHRLIALNLLYLSKSTVLQSCFSWELQYKNTSLYIVKPREKGHKASKWHEFHKLTCETSQKTSPVGAWWSLDNFWGQIGHYFNSSKTSTSLVPQNDHPSNWIYWHQHYQGCRMEGCKNELLAPTLDKWHL